MARRTSQWVWFRATLPALALMVLIFVGSTDALSSQHTSRVLVPLLKWLMPGISPSTIEAVQLGIRKMGHATEYGLLAALLWRAVNASRLGQTRAWPGKRALLAWILATAYACSDEWHQTFVASRQGQWTDVLIDSVGAAVALALIWWVGRWRRRWDEPATNSVGSWGPVSS